MNKKEWKKEFIYFFFAGECTWIETNVCDLNLMSDWAFTALQVFLSGIVIYTQNICPFTETCDLKLTTLTYYFCCKISSVQSAHWLQAILFCFAPCCMLQYLKGEKEMYYVQKGIYSSKRKQEELITLFDV